MTPKEQKTQINRLEDRMDEIENRFQNLAHDFDWLVHKLSALLPSRSFHYADELNLTTRRRAKK